MMKNYKIETKKFNEMNGRNMFASTYDMLRKNEYDYVEVSIDFDVEPYGQVSVWGIKNGSATLLDDNAGVDTDDLDAYAYEVEEE